MKQKKVTVTFQPDGINVSLPIGETIFSAAKKAGIVLTVPCGGHGRCGKCLVLVKSGSIATKGDFHSKHISSERFEEGYRLACQTIVESDVEIFIPPRSRVTDQKILIESLPSEFELNPPVKRLTLSIPQPETHSNMADADRLLLELKKHFLDSQISLPFDILRSLPRKLREKDWLVTVTLGRTGDNELEVLELLSGEPKAGSLLGLAVDIGTTTIASSLFDLESGETLGIASTFNSQMLCGEDIITRIHFASSQTENLEKLQKLVIDDVNSLIRSFKVDPSDIKCISFSGNTVMTHLLFAIDPSFLWREPYTPAVNRLPLIKAGQLGLIAPNNINVYALPSTSSYVGGDVIADILVSGLHRNDRPSLLVDIGTNGEIVLGCRSWLLSCSVPAGPALEGAEVKCGMRASNGAIERISLDLETLEPEYVVIGGTKPAGICGSGLVDLLAELFLAGVLTKAGEFAPLTHNRIRQGDFGMEYLLVEGGKTQTGRDIVLTASDISNLLKTKGAFFAGCSFLLKSVGLSFQDLDSYFIAGGFGNYINPEKAIIIGFYPDLPLEKIKFIGNGSLGGAKLIILSEEMRREAKETSRRLTNIELSNNYDFMDEYTLASFIPHTHLEQFPTVQKMIEEGGIRY